MRVCSASAARVLTLFSLALLSSHSFILANAQPNPTGTDLSPAPESPDDGVPPTGTSTSPAVSPTPTQTSTESPVSTPTSTPTPTSPSPTSKPPASTKSTTPQTSSHTPQTSPSDTDTADSSTDTQTSSPASANSDTSSESLASTATSASTGSSASTTPTATASNTSATVSSASSPTPTATQPSKTLVVGPNSTGQANEGPDTTTYNWLSSTASATGAAADDVSASSKGFFSNKGAVAGTFTVVGVVALGAVFAGVIYAKRRAARLQDEEDMTYFEKYNGPNTDNHDSGHGDLSFGNDNSSEAQIMTHAAPDAYPDRSYPAGTAYARAHAQQGQYQYDGQMGAYGADYSAQYQEAYYDPRRSPNSLAHPYADPRNSPRAEGAPPVQPYGSSAELVEGEAR
ncbi:hypothetical protein ONZ51_g2328 [Trametes cubensis]|uniref:Uncharacterized protein n=1 Tax=Trametes cubensis TaxID=1111947 RepID=A0AAD7U0W6_9APHY|nr:hypothetical protein ONZ51_g2328 [Trametes cubensis]